MDKLNLTLLIPGRLDECFVWTFSSFVGKVIREPDEKNLDAQIRDNEFDVALEWQYGHKDHMVLNLVKKYQKKAKVILCLNWNGKIPDDFDETGYFAYVDTPFTLAKMRKLFKQIKKSLENEK